MFSSLFLIYSLYILNILTSQSHTSAQSSSVVYASQVKQKEKLQRQLKT